MCIRFVQNLFDTSNITHCIHASQPASATFYSTYCLAVEEVISSCSNMENIVLMGDFNYPDTDWTYLSGSAHSTEASKLVVDLATTFSLRHNKYCWQQTRSVSGLDFLTYCLWSYSSRSPAPTRKMFIVLHYHSTWVFKTAANFAGRLTCLTSRGAICLKHLNTYKIWITRSSRTL